MISIYYWIHYVPPIIKLQFTILADISVEFSVWGQNSSDGEKDVIFSLLSAVTYFRGSFSPWNLYLVEYKMGSGIEA